MILEIDYKYVQTKMESPGLSVIHNWPSEEDIGPNPGRLRNFIYNQSTKYIIEHEDYANSSTCILRVYIDNSYNYKSRRRKCLVDTHLLQEMKQTKFPENHPVMFQFIQECVRNRKISQILDINQ